MSKLKELGINIEKPITWLNAEKTSAQATHGVYPFGIDLTSTPEYWEAMQADIAQELIAVQEMAFTVGISLMAMAAAARIERNRLLAESDWTQISDTPILASKRAEWLAYRKSLRDLTEQAGFPQSVVWPQTP